MSKQPNVKANTLFNTIKSVFSIIYPLITFPYISRVLMADNVGKINFGNSIVSYFSLIASLGVTTYAVRECSRVRNDKEQLDKTASQIFSINIFSTIIAYVALAVTLVVARPLHNYRKLICIQSTTILFATLGADWLNTAMEDFKFIAVRTMGMQIVALILMFVFVRHPEDYIIYAVISVIASSGANIVNIFYRRKFCRTKFTLDMDLRRHLPPIMLLFSMILSQTIYCNSDMTMLGLMRSDYEVGLYSTAVKIYNIVNTVVASVAWVVMPQLSENFAKKNYGEINRLLKYSLNFIVVLGLPCIAGINAITTPIIYVLAGEQYIGASVALHILTATLTFSFISGWITNMILLPASRENVCLISSIVAAVINVILNALLIPKFGINGAAGTTAFSQLVGMVIVSRYIEKDIKIDGFRQMIKGPVIGSLTIVVIGVLASFIFKSSYAVTVVAIVLSVAAYVLVLAVTKNEFFLSFIKPVINKIKRR